MTLMTPRQRCGPRGLFVIAVNLFMFKSFPANISSLVMRFLSVDGYRVMSGYNSLLTSTRYLSLCSLSTYLCVFLPLSLSTINLSTSKKLHYSIASNISVSLFYFRYVSRHDEGGSLVSIITHVIMDLPLSYYNIPEVNLSVPQKMSDGLCGMRVNLALPCFHAIDMCNIRFRSMSNGPNSRLKKRRQPAF